MFSKGVDPQSICILFCVAVHTVNVAVVVPGGIGNDWINRERVVPAGKSLLVADRKAMS